MRILYVLLLAVLPAAVLAPAVEAAPRLTALGDTKTARAVTVTEKAGTLTVAVRNESVKDGKLAVDLQLTQGAATAKLEPEVGIGPHGNATAHVAFSGATDFTGFLAIGLEGDTSVAPAVVEVKSAAVPSPRFEQEKATFTVTRVLGPFSRVKNWTWGHADVPLRDAGKANGKVDTEAWLPADSGKILRAHVTGVRGDANGLWHARLDPGDPPRAGEFAGKLLMDPSDTESSSLTVTARVQDFILWPLLAIIAGAGLGGLGRKRHEQWRRRNKHKALLGDTVKKYDCAQKHGGLPTLGSRIGSYGDPDRERCDGEDVLELAELYCTLDKREDEEKLVATEKAVKALVADITAWLELNTAMRTLAAAVAALPPDAELGAGLTDPSRAILPRQDGEELLPGPDAVDDAAVVARARRRADRLSAALTLFTAAWNEHQILTTALAGQDENAYPAAREALLERDPRTIYAGANREYLRTKAQHAELVARLAQAVRELRWYRREVAAATVAAEESSLLMAAIESGPMVTVESPAQIAAIEDAAVEEHAPERIELPDPDEVRVWIRRWDTRVFAFSAAVVALAYLIPTYHDKSFGGVFDYATAFLAGASGAVLIPWELLPAFRTDAAKAEPAAEAA